jgi:hypothetical protein
VTLLGTGGAGKTRLAIEVAGQAASRYGDGTWILPLAPIVDPTLMVSELARVLEVEPVGGEPLDQTVIAAVADRELLLVLDNCEHLLDAAGVVADLLAAAPRVDVLSTSREPLRIRGEQRMDVPPLATEDACELFLARALDVRPELSLEDEDRAALERLCARLDGLPLALELAAARIAVFASMQIPKTRSLGPRTRPAPTGEGQAPGEHRGQCHKGHDPKEAVGGGSPERRCAEPAPGWPAGGHQSHVSGGRHGYHCRSCRTHELGPAPAGRNSAEEVVDERS